MLLKTSLFPIVDQYYFPPLLSLIYECALIVADERGLLFFEGGEVVAVSARFFNDEVRKSLGVVSCFEGVFDGGGSSESELGQRRIISNPKNR